MSKGVPTIPKDDRIVVTCLPAWPEAQVDDGEGPFPKSIQITGPREYSNKGCNFMLADVGGPGVIDIRVIDLARMDLKNVPWRHVEKMCQNRGIETVPIAYDGPGGEAPAELLESAAYVAFRLQQRGPWMLVRRPVLGGTEIEGDLVDLED